jgi:hypothetical protein
MATSYGNPPVVTDGLVLYLDAGNSLSYPGSGTVWRDLSGNSNTGNLTNGPTFNSANAGSIVFDGVDDSVVLPNSPNLSAGSGDFTYNAWVYPIAYDSYAPLFVTATTNGIWIGKNGSNFVLRSYAVADLLSFGTLPILNFWTNIAITRIGTTATLYYNGVSQTTSTTNQNFTQSTTCIASDGPPGSVFSWYNGKISSTLFYKGVGLTSDQILQNYNATKGRFGL